MAIRLGMGPVTAMGQKRAHQEHVTRLTKYCLRGMGFYPQVRPRNYHQGAILFRNVVKMDPQGQHVLKQILGRLDVRNSGLCGRFAEMRTGHTVIAYGNSGISVPEKCPRLARRFVEIKDANQTDLRA